MNFEASTTVETTTTTSFDSINQFMAVFMIIIGVLALYSAFTGKGPAFKNDYPKSMKEEANALLRKFCWIIGPVAIASGVLDYMQVPWGYWAGLALMLPAIVVYVIIFRRKFKEQLKKKR
ncbi:MAG: hypothetical protein PHO15_03225 [Eubacteriales bacterium]|nr:hypothetical protein [Eubacteriales bacterium]